MDQLILKLFGENSVALGLRILGLEKLKAFAEVAAGDLAGPWFDVDVAAYAMEEECQGVDEAMAGVFEEQFRFPADAGLLFQQVELGFPGGVIDFAVGAGLQLFAEEVAVAGEDRVRLGEIDQHGDGVEEVVVKVAGIDILGAEGEDMGIAGRGGCEVGDGKPVGGQGRVHGDQGVPGVEFRGLFGVTLPIGGGRRGGGRTLEERDEEDDYFAEPAENAQREGEDGFLDKIANIFGGKRDGGGVVRENRSVGGSIPIKSLGEIAEVELSLVQAGEICG